MPQFIGRPNLPNIPVPVIPSKDEQIYNALSGLLGQFTQHNLNMSEQRGALAKQKELVKFTQDALNLRSREDRLVDTIKTLLEKGGKLGQAKIREGPLARGQSPSSMLEPAPEGSLNIADIATALGITPRPDQLGQTITRAKKEVKPVRGPDAINRAMGIRTKLLSQLKNYQDNPDVTDEDRDSLKSQISEVEEELTLLGAPGFKKGKAAPKKEKEAVDLEELVSVLGPDKKRYKMPRKNLKKAQARGYTEVK